MFPLIGLLSLLGGSTMLYAAYKNESFTGVIQKTLNPSYTGSESLPTVIKSASPQGNVGVQASGSVSGSYAPVVAYAHDQLGKPYIYAADGPFDFDCSGLSMKAYQQVGVSLPHNAQAQYEQTKQYTLTDQWVPGALCFFGDPNAGINGLHHVGIVIGDNQMINAPHTGAFVRVDAITGQGGEGDFYATTLPPIG